MNSQQLLFANFIILLGLVLFFTLGRSKPKQPVKLNLASSKNDADGGPQALPELHPVPVTEELRAREVNVEKKSVYSQAGAEVKKLSSSQVVFVYNGHEWDAFEVLGLAKGATLQAATGCYQDLIKRSDPSTFEFYEAAYTAILKKKKEV